MTTFRPFGAKTYFLGSSISSTATTILLSSFLEPVTGTPYTMVLLDTDIVYATIAPKTASSEFISFTGITQNSDGTATLTGVTRGLAKKYPFTSDSAYKLPHAGQSVFIISDAPQVFNEYSVIEADETITGLKTFLQFPITPSSLPTTPYQVANKAYVDSVSFNGAPNASTSVQGLVQEATLAQVLARTATGSTGAKLFIPLDKNISTLVSDYVADTGTANTYAIAPTPAITAYVTGQIFTFKATNANTTASTLAVSGLASPKTIKNSVGGNLVANDILAGQLVTVQYDGTNFQMLNVSGRGAVGMSGAETIAGLKNFTILPQSSAVPGTGNDLTNKTYVDGAIHWTYISSASFGASSSVMNVTIPATAKFAIVVYTGNWASAGASGTTGATLVVAKTGAILVQSLDEMNVTNSNIGASVSWATTLDITPINNAGGTLSVGGIVYFYT